MRTGEYRHTKRQILAVCRFVYRIKKKGGREEMKYEKLSIRALYCMYVAGILVCAVSLVVIGAVNYFWIFPENIRIGKAISVLLIVLLLLDTLISPYFRYHRYRYSINEECIDIREGYLFIKRNIVPIERLHKLKTVKGPIDQLFKVEKVVVTTGGGDVTISFLEEKRAEQIAESLRRRINEIAAEQKEKDRSDEGREGEV
ncbi:PH domain-containing protein [Faecalicatena acetigenes]|uniref:PH domain-containing protein n=2 Tax=Lachnospiraceae TaxID=186803 RepID=A0ABT2TDW2_9FIRM|nr:PH domain-containing protein [Faecalicatena acetigenes]MCU6748474.1 PH domain-containing protein [Faecalicatena acetigenes]